MQQRLKGATHWEDPRVVTAAACLAVLVLFVPTLASLPAVWLAPGFSHGWLVAGLTGWLVWRHRHQLVATEGRADPALLVLLIGLSLLWVPAIVTNLRAVHQAMLTAVLVCWLVAVAGPGSARVAASIGATFLLAVPIWGALVPVLRQMTIVASGGLVHLLQIPAEIEGDVISITSGRFLVEDGCAGLNYLLAGLVTGVFYAQLLLRHWRTRVAVVAMIAALSIVGNWIRVTSLVVIGHVTQMQSSLMDDHLWLGWLIFALTLTPFLLLTRRIERHDTARAEASGSRTPTVPREPSEPSSAARRALTPTLCVAVGPVLYFSVGALPTADLPPFTDPPGVDPTPAWLVMTPAGVRPYAWEPGFSGATRHESWELSSGNRRVFVDELVFLDQSQNAEMISHANRIAPDSSLVRDGVVRVPDDDDRWIRQAIVRTPEAPILVWYWFRVGGADTVLPAQAKLLEVWAFMRRRPVSAVISISTACEIDGCEEALQDVRSLVAGSNGTVGSILGM